VAQEVLHLARGVGVDQVDAPALRLVGAARVPHRERPRLAGERRSVREDGARPAEEPPQLTAPALAVFLAAAEVVGHERRVLVRGRDRRVVRAQEGDHGVAEVREGHVEPARFLALRHVAPALAARPDADHVDRAVAHAVIAIAREVLRRELPVAGDQPLVNAADDLGAAFAAVPRVEQQIEVELVAAEVLEERRGRAVPRRPDHPLVVLHLRDFDEAPAAAVELLAVRVLREWHPDERAVGAVAPAVIGAQELGGVAVVVAAHLHAAVAARVQEDVNRAAAVATEDDGLLAHERGDEVTRPRDLALVAHEEPGAGEHLLELLPVDRLADEDLPADDPSRDVDQAVETHLRALLAPAPVAADDSTAAVSPWAPVDE
jgi:hypothetical protein